MMIIEGPRIPTPFGGSIKLPDLETPPISLPTIPDARGQKAIAHGIGEDLAFLINKIPIPWFSAISAPLADAIEDMHYCEITKLLTPDEYGKFLEHNKVLPTSVALARVLCFKEVKEVKELGRLKGLLPTMPQEGPPLPRILGVKWKKA